MMQWPVHDVHAIHYTDYEDASVTLCGLMAADVITSDSAGLLPYACPLCVEAVLSGRG